MDINDRIDLLITLGEKLTYQDNEVLEKAITRAHQENQWFVPENSRMAINTIAEKMLSKDALTTWISNYSMDASVTKNVGIVMAGNIPLVGFHDLLCSFVSGHNTIVKTSSKDDALVKAVVKMMCDIHHGINDRIKLVDKLSGFDAVIATGSNNTAQHFEYYFRDRPNIIRKNRTSVAVIHSDESREDLTKLGSDVFDYFGLGCRNISKLYIPRGYSLDIIFESFYGYKEIINHNKYKNNYDYNEAIYLMGKDPFLTNGFILLREDTSLHSRIASLHYEYYDDEKSVLALLNEHKDSIQCVASQKDLGTLDVLPFGKCQSPGLMDYADGVDTMAFLTQL